MSMRDFESTPGQLYCRRCEAEMTMTRKGRWSRGSLPFSSLGRMRALAALLAEQFPLHQQVSSVRVDPVRGLERRHPGKPAPIDLRVRLLEGHEVLDRLAHHLAQE